MCPYISVWNSQIKYILACTEYMPLYTFTADFLSWMRGHILVHTRPPAPCWPACTLRACSAFESSAFVAATRHTWSRTNKCIIMSAATGLRLAKSSLFVDSSKAIGSTGSARKRLRARPLRCLGDKFALECCRQSRAPEIDRLYPPSWGCLDRQEQQLFRYGQECAVMTLKSLHKSNQWYFSQSAFKRSTIIEEHRNWRCVAGQKLKFREFSWIFHSVTSPCVPSIDCFDSIVFEPTNSDTYVYWEPSFSKTMSNENS